MFKYTFNCKCIENEGKTSYCLKSYNLIIFKILPLILFETDYQYSLYNGYLNQTPFNVKYITCRLSFVETKLIILFNAVLVDGGLLLNPLILGNNLNKKNIYCVKTNEIMFIVKKNQERY